MPRMSKKRKEEWAFFLNDRSRIAYNALCRKCVYNCKQILWSKRCKDEALRGTVKETITQVSRSKKKYQELKKKAQPYLDALEIASERVRAFLDVVLSRGKETQEHKQSVHRRGHDMEH